MSCLAESFGNDWKRNVAFFSMFVELEGKWVALLRHWVENASMSNKMGWNKNNKLFISTKNYKYKKLNFLNYSLNYVTNIK